HHHIGKPYLLDLSPFAFHDHHIIKTDGLRDGDLDACQQSTNGFLSRETEDDPGDPGRGDHTDPDLPDAVKGHQCNPDGKDNDDGHEDPFQDVELSVIFSGSEVVGEGDVKATQDPFLGYPDSHYYEPGDAENEEQTPQLGNKGIQAGICENIIPGQPDLEDYRHHEKDQGEPNAFREIPRK